MTTCQAEAPGADGSQPSDLEWSIIAVQDVIAAAVPDRDMIVCGDTRRTFDEVARRSKAIASFLGERGLGIHAERVTLERWESGQDAVALVLGNSVEYLEAMLGTLRARAVPFNVNQHYRPAEVHALVTTVGANAVFYHRRYAALLAESGISGVLLIDVDDGSGVDPLPGSVNFELVVSAPIRQLPTSSPDDLFMMCTGGTTGQPKAVLWRQGDIYVSAMAGKEGATATSIADAARQSSGAPWYPIPPLMHAAAQWTSFCGLNQGATIVLHDDSGSFDARTVLEVAERERVALMAIVGDAHAGPMIEELRRRPYDLSSMAILATGGAATNERHKEALLELLPHILINDGYGSSETGGMAFGARTKAGRVEGFAPSRGAIVVSADRSTILEPGDPEVGWTARRGRVPLGYLGDREKTEAAFPVIEGERFAIPGDRARILEDGHIVMLGRDALVVNTGGEKVYVEEVEEVVRRHPDVADGVVVGRPSERFGQEVVAVVAPKGGVDLDPRSVREFVASQIARFKAPRAVAVCPSVVRHANGKPDYRWAAEMAALAQDVATRKA